MKESYYRYYDELPPPIAERAKRNFDSVWSSGIPRSAAEAIEQGFRWSTSPEGEGHWLDVFNASRGRRNYPSVKGLPQ